MRAGTGRRRGVVFFGLLAVSGLNAPARAESLYFPNQPNAGGDNTLEDIDFASTSIPTGTTGALSGNKFVVVNLATYNSKAQCFSIKTAGDGSGDTRIWVYDSTINDYRSLNDDVPGSRYAAARVWISPPSNGGRYASPTIASFAPVYNAMKFSIQLQKLTAATTEAQCTSGATYKTTASGNVFVNNS